ncbi:MAG: hypothetical protein Q8K74_02935 [Candidatus Nitrotoga sp.]|nr:hypothetical protein [Candidatus Nitrotoga sp.]MDP1854991.1 hypothetical protein [Candidatus Nitrotoga sp.]
MAELKGYPAGLVHLAVLGLNHLGNNHKLVDELLNRVKRLMQHLNA